MTNKFYDEIVGHDFQKELLFSSLNSGKLHHAYLFSGRDGLGKTFFAIQTIKTAFSLKNNREAEKVNNNHPDVMFIKPTEKNILIDQVKEVNNFLQFAPLSAPFKFIVIDQADKMNLSAQNAILKILEEPPDFAIFFLITSAVRKLLPTILSRVVEVKFFPLNDEEMELFYKKKNIEKPDLAYVFSGYPAYFINDEENHLGEKAENWYETIMELMANDLNRSNYFVTHIDKIEKEDFFLFLKIFYEILIDIVKIIDGNQKIKWKKLLKYEKIIINRWNTEELFYLVNKINRLEKLIPYNINIKLYFESVFAELISKRGDYV